MGVGSGVREKSPNAKPVGMDGQLSKGMARIRSSNPGKNPECHFKERKDQTPRPGGMLRRKMHFLPFCG